MRSKVGCAILVTLALCKPAYSQNSWQDAISEIKKAPSRTILNIGPGFTTSENILKADRIVFQDNATLTLLNHRKPYWVIVAKEITFSAPNYTARIQRDPRLRAAPGNDGTTATVKPPTPPQAPNGGRRGADGANGADGGPGGRGETEHLPPLYIAASKVTRQAGGSSGFVDLVIRLDGVDGGRGGDGGDGGPAGDGGSGGNGVSLAFSCDGGPGDGGNGGSGGKGGAGGSGGAGGDASDVFFVGDAQVLNELETSRVLARGGVGGPGGYAGAPGRSGEEGPRGARRGFCIGGTSGNRGTTPKPRDLGHGVDSDVEGKRGDIKSITYDVAKLF